MSKAVFAAPLLAAWLSGASGCIDPKERYDAFIDTSADMRGGGSGDAGMFSPGERFDFSGDYLCALATTLAPDSPILLRCSAVVSEDLSTIDFEFQPLTTDASETPRQPVGNVIVAEDVAFAMDGSFRLDLGELTVPGLANPISGSEIVANVVLDASAYPADSDLPNRFCGNVSGTVTQPVVLDLTGSTLGAVATSDPETAEPLTFCTD